MWLIVLSSYALMSAITLIVFWRDKVAAMRNRWRIPELTLHALELLGGWPGALLGQKLQRHKSSKFSYRLTLWAIILLHITAWIAWLWWRPRDPGA